jgi:molybdenum cofactor guanylyltransferase
LSGSRRASGAPLAGLFVGGAATRMGGAAKGLLPAPEGGTLIERALRVLHEAGVGDVVLVGRSAAYPALGLDALGDEPAGIGPLGGLVALLRRAAGGSALALACDMPFVTRALVARLISAPFAPVVAPRLGDRWEPLCARYDAATVLPLAVARASGADHSLQRLLDAAGARALALEPDDARALRDWDRPEDMR